MKVRAILLALALGPFRGTQGWEVASDDGCWKFQLEPRVIAEAWLAEKPAPGLLDFDEDAFFAPRLDLLMTAEAGERWSVHALARWDRGFDPGARDDGDFRLDEAFLRWRPWGDNRFSLQVGKFATVFGNWPARHDFWDHPFLTPPLPYGRQSVVTDRRPTGLAQIAANLPQADKNDRWLPIIWGPSYSTGAAILGSLGEFDYALEVKDDGLSSRPVEWGETGDFLGHPTITGRLGWRPNAAWAVGLSGSRGGYLRAGAADRDDFTQTIVGLDARWAWRHFMLTGEVIASRFDTAAGDLDSLGWYLEGRYKINHRCWAALRVSQQQIAEFDGPQGRSAWDHDAWSLEGAVGVRLTENTLLKLAYGYVHETSDHPQGEHTLGVAVGARF